MLLADSHTHLDQYPLAEIPDILERAQQARVGLIICAGTTIASSRACIELSRAYGPTFAGVGIHPMEVKGPIDGAVYSSLRDLALNNPKVVCISEIGLDFLPESPDRELQYQAFREQIPPRQGIEAAHHFPLPRVPPRGDPNSPGRKGLRGGWSHALFPGGRSNRERGHRLRLFRVPGKAFPKAAGTSGGGERAASGEYSSWRPTPRPSPSKSTGTTGRNHAMCLTWRRSSRS